MTDLKPCPFCGGPCEKWEVLEMCPCGWYYTVIGCRKCNISFDYNKGEGVTKWNRRVENLKEVDVDSLAECEYNRPTFRTGEW